MNKKVIVGAVALAMAIVAHANPCMPSYHYGWSRLPRGYYTTAQQQRVMNTRQAVVAMPTQVAAARTCNTPGAVRQVYVRAKYKIVTDAYGNKTRVYIPAHYETRVGTYR